MIEQLYVVSSGGVVLFHKSFSATSRRSTVDALIQDYLLEDRAGDKECILDDVRLRWSIHSSPDLFVVGVYPRTRTLQTIAVFLDTVRDAFVRDHGRHVDAYDFDAISFSAAFQKLYDAFDAAERCVAHVGVAGSAARRDDDENRREELSEAVTADSPSRGGNTAPPGGIVAKDGRVIAKRGSRPTAAAAAVQPASTTGSKKKPKQATVWATSSDPSVGTSSSVGPSEDEIAQQTELTRKTFIKLGKDGNVAPIQEREWEGQKRGRLATWLRSYVGSRELEQQDFATVLPKLREKLISKNVAVEVSEHVCSSIEASLTGKKLGTFDSLQGAIEDAMVDALRRILQPKIEINILRSVAAAVARKRPYSIVLCGVNGVGKSTSLAKIAYWLQTNGHSLLVAAGDTFRHGAVEQLEVHGRCLGVPIFQMGYGTDPSAVAAAALAQAARAKTDVVLIDTAGRMQDHESRMRALAKLIHDNQPDLVLFVGEALVGNNGVDQLRKFNQCLLDYTPVGQKPRGIDGIVLTKFDTIDDKVGAALTMVYELGQPIVFVGVGQTYQDLKVIDADVVVNALMQ